MKALDDASSQTVALYTELTAASARFADSGQTDLAALLLNSGLQSVPGDPIGLSRLTAAMLRGSSAGLINGQRMSFWL
jgi:hypothetical protein